MVELLKPLIKVVCLMLKFVILMQIQKRKNLRQKGKDIRTKSLKLMLLLKLL